MSHSLSRLKYRNNHRNHWFTSTLLRKLKTLIFPLVVQNQIESTHINHKRTVCITDHWPIGNENKNGNKTKKGRAGGELAELRGSHIESDFTERAATDPRKPRRFPPAVSYELCAKTVFLLAVTAFTCERRVFECDGKPFSKTAHVPPPGFEKFDPLPRPIPPSPDIFWGFGPTEAVPLLLLPARKTLLNFLLPQPPGLMLAWSRLLLFFQFISFGRRFSRHFPHEYHHHNQSGAVPELAPMRDLHPTNDQTPLTDIDRAPHSHETASHHQPIKLL